MFTTFVHVCYFYSCSFLRNRSRNNLIVSRNYTIVFGNSAIVSRNYKISICIYIVGYSLS